MMGIVLPVFAVLNAACSNGLMAGGLRRTVEHVTRTRHSDTGATLADLPTIRGYIARMRLKADMSDALLSDTLAAVVRGSAPTRHCAYSSARRRQAKPPMKSWILPCASAAGLPSART